MFRRVLAQSLSRAVTSSRLRVGGYRTTAALRATIEAIAPANEVRTEPFPDPEEISEVHISKFLTSPPVDVATNNRLIHVLGYKGRVDDARRLYAHMTNTGIAPDAQTYASLIHGAARAGRPEEAQGYYDEMVARGVRPNVAVYSALVTAWRGTSLERAVGQLKVMRKAGVQPNEVVYTAVIQACIAHRNYSKAWDVFGEMRYWNVTPDEVTYNAMIAACAKAREAERALLLYEEMQEKGLHIGIHVYGALLHAVSLRYDMHVRTFQVLQDMQQANVRPDARGVASLLHSCGTVGNVLAAHTVWNNMTRPGSRLFVCEPGLHMYNSLLKTYANAIRSRVPEVLKKLTLEYELVLDVAEAAEAMRAESIDHHHVATKVQANAHINVADTSDAAALVPSEAPLLEIREEWTVGELLDAGQAVLAAIQARGLAPDVYTANRIIEGYAWGLQMSTAIDTLYNMEKLFGVGPDCESYRLVIGMCIKLDQINTAYDVWEHMHTTLPGSAHDKGTYKHLMYGCQKVGAYQQLVRVAAGMVGAGIVPAPAELMQLRERLLRSNEELVWDEIKTLCQKADKTNLWAIKDAQYRLELGKYQPYHWKSRHKRKFEK